MKAYPIWQIKFCTQEVLVDTSKVSNGKVFIYFVADRNHTDLYSFNGSWVRQTCPVVYNGKIYCYAIPMRDIYNEGALPKELEQQRELEYEKFKKYKEKLNTKK